MMLMLMLMLDLPHVGGTWYMGSSEHDFHVRHRCAVTGRVEFSVRLSLSYEMFTSLVVESLVLEGCFLEREGKGNELCLLRSHQ